jgi:hypothetical protein
MDALELVERHDASEDSKLARDCRLTLYTLGEKAMAVSAPL